MIAPHPDPAGAGPLVGIVPAAGRAVRLGSPTGSKELLPVWRPSSSRAGAPLPAIGCHLSSFERAGVDRAFVVFRTGKEDIPSALGTETDGGMRLDYIEVESTPSPPFTLAAAVPQLSGATVVMGFPDILFEPLEAVRRILTPLRQRQADIVLGLFPHPLVRRADVLDLEANGLVREVHSSCDPTADAWTWGLAAWSPRFTRFLHDCLAGFDAAEQRAGCLGVSDVLNAAIKQGLVVRGEVASDTPFLDIGTPDALEEAYRRLDDL